MSAQQNSGSIEIIFTQRGCLLQWLHTQASSDLKVGDGPGCAFFVEGLAPTPLLRSALEVAPSWTLEEFSTKQRDGFVLRLMGDSVITVRRSAGTTGLLPQSRQRKKELAPYLVGSTLFHSLVLFLLFRIDPDQRRITLEPPPSPSQVVSVKANQTELKENIPTLWSEKMNKGLLGEDQGKLHKLDSGAMGKLTSKAFYGRYKIKGDSQRARPAEISSVANQVGILSVIKGNNANGAPFASVFGREEMEYNDTETILGGLYGYEHNESEGGYGLGLRGTGIGGKSKGEGTLGAGAMGFGGGGAGGSCDATCSGMGLGRGGMIGSGVGIKAGIPLSDTHKAGAPEVSDGAADVVGRMDKSAIRRVIQRAMPGIKYCYEQGLQKRAGLEGKVSIRFIIGPTGAVLDAKATAGIDPVVDQCVAKKVSQLAFPAPDGVIEVNYPFYFQSK